MSFPKRFFTHVVAVICFCLAALCLTSESFASGSNVPNVINAYCSYCGTGRSFYLQGSAPSYCGQMTQASFSCSVCGFPMMQSFSPQFSDHIWREVSRTAATCNNSGMISYSCFNCPAARSEPISPLGHFWIETSRLPASCTVPGTVYYACSRCTSTSMSTLSQLGHSWTETERVTPTCTAAGSQDYSCSRCDETKTESIPALGGDHDWTETGRAEPTCLPGSIDYTCSKCQDTKSEEIPALENAHAYEVAEIIQAEYDSGGHMTTPSYIRYSCSVCGDGYQQVVGASPSGPTLMDGDGGDGMQDATAALGKSLLSGIWKLFGIYVPGFSFTFGQMWLGVLLASISILVVRMIFGFGGGSRGLSPRTSSASRPRISKERRNDEF